MKRNLLGLSISFGVSLLFSTAFALSTISGDVEEDLYFAGGALIEGVDLPSNATASTGSASVTLGGSGTVTVASRSGGGLPRLTLYGGTRITSTRSWGEVLTKSWWQGQLSPPANGRLPKIDEISFGSVLSANSTAVVLSSFNLGLSNETFTFSQPATVILPVRSEDQVKLLIAMKQSNGSWTVGGDAYCLVENGICGVELSSMNEIALVKETFSRCPRSTVSNGQIGGIPSCKVSCDRGYELDATLTECIPELEDDFDDLDLEGEDISMDDIDAELGFEEESATTFRSHTFKGSRSNWLGEGGEVVEEEETIEEKFKRAQDDTFLNYLLQMRNRFGEGSSPNVFGAAEEEEPLIGGETGDLMDIDTDVLLGEETHASAPMLPSTGPGIFLGIAALGLGMMMVGSRKR